MTLRATMDNVVLKQLQSPSYTDSGIKLPEHDIHQGEVVSVGPKCLDEQLRVNSVVAFSAYTGTEVTIDGEKYLIVKYNDIVGIIDAIRTKSE